MIRWGIVGPGSIATDFAQAMELVSEGSIVAVASRSAERAQAFADRFGIPRHYGDYRYIADDPEIDVVYVATPQSRHALDTLELLQAGKHVLCEKPFALNSREVHKMVEEARQRGLFLMEAIWSRFLPAYRVLVDQLGSGRIGDPLLVEADFGFRSPVSLENRLFRPDLGGGGLLDLGIYPLQLCSLVLGRPLEALAYGVIGETEVDEQVVAVTRHGGSKLGAIKAGIRVNMACTARISGTEGVINIPAWMHCPDAISVTSGIRTKEFDCSFEGNGLRFEIEEVQRCLGAGQTESATMPLDESIVLTSTLDSIRGQIGLKFPGE